MTMLSVRAVKNSRKIVLKKETEMIIVELMLLHTIYFHNT